MYSYLNLCESQNPPRTVICTDIKTKKVIFCMKTMSYCCIAVIYATLKHYLNHESKVSYIYIYISGGPLSALTCCVNARLLSAIKKNIAVNLFSKLGWELGLYYASYDDFHPDILARMYT